MSENRSHRRDNEPTGEAESLVGRINVKEMGSRAFKEDVNLETKKLRNAKEAEKREKKQQGLGGKRKIIAGGMRYGDILEATQDCQFSPTRTLTRTDYSHVLVEGLNYRPRTAETRAVYELMLASVHSSLGDQPQDMVRSAADLVLETLKSDSLKDFDKKKEIESLVGVLSAEAFASLIALSKKITDYGEEEEKGHKDEDMKEGAIDDDVGVAVVFEDEEEEDDEEEGFEVRDESDGSEDELETAETEDVPTGDIGSDEENIILGDSNGNGKASGSKTSDIVSAHEIDGFWLQRLIAQSIPDPQEASEKTAAAMGLLSSEQNLRDVENALMELFDYEKFDLVRVLLKNREKIVWCTKLARSDDNEKVDVEVAMREKNLGWILKELAGDRVRKGDDSMDIDSKPDIKSMKGNLAPGSSAPAPQKMVDLEGMAFSQGARLMSNKKCKLPEGSFKRSKKGYEEVHVPAPQKAPIKPGEESVSISDLPLWAREAFKGTEKLNRIQSRLYPIAFGTDEPILLCAPTGGGKVSVFITNE